jgi:hypothetical protein
LTVSIGVATVPTDSKDAEDLIRKADDALYRAKGLGKNRVQVYSDERREFTRFNVCLVGKVKVLYRDVMTVTTSNISQGGFQINSNRWLPVGSVVQLDFNFGPQRHNMNCIADIVWVSGQGQKYQAGVKIIQADPAQFYEFKRFLHNLPGSKRLASN